MRKILDTPALCDSTGTGGGVKLGAAASGANAGGCSC